MEPTNSTSTKQPSVSKQASEPTAESPKRNPLKIVGIVIVALLLLAVGLYLYISNITHDSAKVADKFVTAVQKSDVNTAYSLTGDQFQGATTKTEMETIFASISGALQGSTRISGRIAETRNNKTYNALIYTVTTKNAGDKYIRVVLEKTDDGWKVTNFRSSATKLDAKVE